MDSDLVFILNIFIENKIKPENVLILNDDFFRTGLNDYFFPAELLDW